MADLAMPAPSSDAPIASDEPQYPSINLTGDQAEACNLNDVMVGDEVTLTVKATVSKVGDYEKPTPGSSPSVTLHITDIESEGAETESEPDEPAARPRPKAIGPKEAGLLTAGEEE